MTIASYLSQDLVRFLEASSQAEAITELVDCLDAAGKLIDRPAFHLAILEREKIVSTGIGLGVAIPHAKLAGYDDFFIAIGIQKGRAIPWHSLDDAPVQIIFMIGGPEDRQTEYLNILSLLTSAIKDGERRKKLIKATQSGEVLSVFQGL
jgi:PTS system nitrogen regulatory IIA component